MINISTINKKNYSPLEGAIVRNDVYDIEFYSIDNFSMEDISSLHTLMDTSGLDKIICIVYKTTNKFIPFMSNKTKLHTHLILIDTTSDTIIANSSDYPDVPSDISKKFLTRSDYEEQNLLKYIANSVYGLNSTTPNIIQDEKLLTSYCIDKYKSRNILYKMYKYLQLKLSK